MNHKKKTDMKSLRVDRKERGRHVLQIEERIRAEIISVSEFLKAKYKEDKILDIFKSHEGSRSDTN
jgi:hypothetical protein